MGGVRSIAGGVWEEDTSNTGEEGGGESDTTPTLLKSKGGHWDTDLLHLKVGSEKKSKTLKCYETKSKNHLTLEKK